MKSTASRSPFQASAIAVALASSLFALTACGGGGGDSSTTSGTAGSASGGATAVASNAQGSSGTGNGTASSGAPQGQGTAGSGTQQVPDAVASSALQGLGTADSSAQQGLGAAGSSLDLGPGNGPSNSAAQAAAWSGKGIGTEFARRIHAACPTFDIATHDWESKATVPSVLSCVAGSYAARTFGRVSVARSTLLPMGMFAPAAGGVPSGRSVRPSLEITVGKMVLSVSS